MLHSNKNNCNITERHAMALTPETLVWLAMLANIQTGAPPINTAPNQGILKQEHIAQKQQVMYNSKKKSREQKEFKLAKRKKYNQPRQKNYPINIRYRKRSMRTKPRSSHK